MSADDTTARLAAIDTRLAAATPGDWKVDTNRPFSADADLIANAPADLAWQSATIRALIYELTRLQQGINEAHEQIDTADDSGLPFDAVVQLCNILTALSQPTTDTNGAHA